MQFRFLSWIMKREVRKARTTYWVEMVLNRIGRNFSDVSELLTSTDLARLKSDKLVIVDLGARGGVPDQLKALSDFSEIIMFEPDPEEFTNLTATFRNNDEIVVLPFAIGATDGRARLFLTKKRACSSLLEPHGVMSDLLGASVNGANSEYGDATRFDVDRTEIVECRTIASSLSDRVEEIDVLKIDTQGLEFEILRGLGRFRPFVIVVECSTTELYKGQETVFEVGSLLRSLGYFPASLMENHLVPNRTNTVRRTIPLHGDCIFVPDLSQNGRQIILRDPLKWWTALGIYGHMDLALWQSSKMGLNPKALM